mmetsp:Transcript_51855/g.96998  ORF Transcript_51855/g.96998 Transcript_51855/m.96998 type:complete len:212 (-) Transcript_51855:341-976(-)
MSGSLVANDQGVAESLEVRNDGSHDCRRDDQANCAGSPSCQDPPRPFGNDFIHERNVVHFRCTKHLKWITYERPQQPAACPGNRVSRTFWQLRRSTESLLGKLVAANHAPIAYRVSHQDGAGPLPKGPWSLQTVDGLYRIDHAAVSPFRSLHTELHKVNGIHQHHFGGASCHTNHSSCGAIRLLHIPVRSERIDVEVQNSIVDHRFRHGTG